MKKDEIVATSRKRLDLAYAAERGNREHSLDDLRFITGVGQWDDVSRQEREQEGKPLPDAQLPAAVCQAGDRAIRDPEPGHQTVCGGCDSEASEEVAEILEGLIRHIEYKSDHRIYEATGESARIVLDSGGVPHPCRL